MLRYHLNWKVIQWAIVIGITILLVVTWKIYQSNVEDIDQHLQNFKTL